MRRRIARAAIIGSLGIATLSYGALEKHVTVRIEGRPVAVRTFAATVGEALARARVSVGPDDRVVPSPDARVREGSVIDVYRAKRITLLLDGKPRRVIVTGLTIQEVLDEVALRGSLVDSVHPSRDARIEPGMTIVYRHAVAVTVLHDGERDQVVTNEPTVGAVVRNLGIRLGKRDRIEPKASAVPVSDMTIRVLRVGVRKEMKEVVLPFSTVQRRDSTLEYGRRKVIREGRTGLRRITFRSTYVNGERVSRRVLRTVTIREARARIVAVGTKSPTCDCASGSQRGKASFYYAADGLTAAHRTLPFGTVVRVENLANGKVVYVTIRDRGPYVEDWIIDLSDEAFGRIASLGSGVINVRISW